MRRGSDKRREDDSRDASGNSGAPRKRLPGEAEPKAAVEQPVVQPQPPRQPVPAKPRAEVQPPRQPVPAKPRAEVQPPRQPASAKPRAEVQPPRQPASAKPRAEVQPPRQPAPAKPTTTAAQPQQPQRRVISPEVRIALSQEDLRRKLGQYTAGTMAAAELQKFVDNLQGVHLMGQPVATIEDYADTAAELAGNFLAGKPLRRNYLQVARRLHQCSLQYYQSCYSQEADQARLLTHAYSYLTTMEEYLAALIQQPIEPGDVAGIKSRLGEFIGRTFEYTTTILASRDKRERLRSSGSAEAFSENWYEMIRRDGLQFYYMVVRLSVLRPDILGRDELLRRVGAAHSILKETHDTCNAGKAECLEISRFLCSLPILKKLGALPSSAVNGSSSSSSASAVGALSACFIALPTPAMFAAPGYGFTSPEKNQVAGDSAYRLAWMLRGVEQGLMTAGASGWRRVQGSQQDGVNLLHGVYSKSELSFLQGVCQISANTKLPFAIDTLVEPQLDGRVSYSLRRWETFVSKDSWAAVLDCAANIDALIKAVLASGNPKASALAVQRPPGHHAGVCGLARPTVSDNPGQGFCVMNAVASAAIKHALAGRKVMIVDIDVHSGNGTQHLLARVMRNLEGSEEKAHLAKALRENLCFVNAFENHNYPYESSHPYDGGASASPDKVLADAFPNMVVNLPYRQGASGAEIVDKVTRAVTAVYEAGFLPGVSLCSYGMDAHKDDLISHAQMGQEDYQNILLALRGPIVIVPEGGYSPGVQAAMTAAVRACKQRVQPAPTPVAQEAVVRGQLSSSTVQGLLRSGAFAPGVIGASPVVKPPADGAGTELGGGVASRPR